MRRTAAAFAGLVLLCCPCPSWSQDGTAALIDICDQAAAAPLDQSRPTGVPGLLLEKIDSKVAIPACDVAAKAAPNDPRVAFQLGRAYLAAKDYESARVHFKFAADQGDAGGQNGLGVLYQGGRSGLAKDDQEAARLFKLAADQGNANGQVNLGFFYATGRGGLAKDDREAARHYKLAADQGNAGGQVYLGVFYATGGGGLTKDDREAARLYKLAADQEYPSGQGKCFRTAQSRVLLRDGPWRPAPGRPRGDAPLQTRGRPGKR
jgi:TPR repeat protein